MRRRSFLKTLGAMAAGAALNMNTMFCVGEVAEVEVGVSLITKTVYPPEEWAAESLSVLYGPDVGGQILFHKDVFERWFND